MELFEFVLVLAHFVELEYLVEPLAEGSLLGADYLQPELIAFFDKTDQPFIFYLIEIKCLQ
jgi:hypothetical protein